MEKKRIKKRGITILIVLLFIIIVGSIMFSLLKKTESLPKTEDLCSLDSDCVPSSCCHATSCTTKAQAPSCTMAICSQVCASGSLDCGQGSCGCVKNKCQAVLK